MTILAPRNDVLQKLKSTNIFDVIIIGGGIQGCAMLLEAQSRGLNALLVEKRDYCSQTSANSLKTIHGGIRYLQTLNLKKTLTSIKEQNTIITMAPGLVTPLQCILPSENNNKSRSSWMIRAGFFTYNFLKRCVCQNSKLANSSWINKSQLLKLVPTLDLPQITGAGLWYDAQVQHTERLGLAFIKTAVNGGAVAVNYTSAVEIKTLKNNSNNVLLKNEISAETFFIEAKTVIDCCAEERSEILLNDFNAVNSQNYCLAVNIVTEKSYTDCLLGLSCGFMDSNAEKKDKRLLIAAPWQGHTLFGTWYFNEDRDKFNKQNKVVNAKYINYCLNQINSTFAKVNISNNDILQIHYGWLPVNKKNRNPENELCELSQIVQPEKQINYYVVQTSKYTSCRDNAQRTIDLIKDKQNLSISKSVSKKTKLSGYEFDDKDALIEQACNKYSQILNPKVISQLIINYGLKTQDIYQMCLKDTELKNPIPGTDNHVIAQIDYAITHEQALFLSDFISRRSFLMAQNKLSKETLLFCANRMGLLLNWSQSQINDEVETCLNGISAMKVSLDY